jgi:ABC-type nitrate/sulfonate/bicarbonate transport system substrate-binding protein
MTSSRRVLLLPATITVITLGMTGCSSSADGAENTADADTTTVSVALDWTANTNHIGLFVADELGYFADAGIDLEVLPYASAPTVDLVSSGAADFGVSTQSTVQNARTAGADIISTYAVVQNETGALVTLGDRTDITSPADLDGKIYGGFGIPLYSAIARTAIQDAGGTGAFEDVTLTTGSYEALTSGAIDFTASIVTWENVFRELEGDPYQTFLYSDFGVPAEQTIVLASSDAYLDGNADTAEAFLGAVQKGYAFAADDPEAAADLLIEANPDVLGGSEELVHASARLLADDNYFVAEDGSFGTHNAETWSTFGDYLVEQELLTDENGDPVTETPDWTGYYTDAFLGE